MYLDKCSALPSSWSICLPAMQFFSCFSVGRGAEEIEFQMLWVAQPFVSLAEQFPGPLSTIITAQVLERERERGGLSGSPGPFAGPLGSGQAGLSHEVPVTLWPISSLAEVDVG